MPRNSFIQMTKLHNVRGRIYYISSPKKQENLYAVYETTERSFWSDLAKCNHAEFKKSGTEGKCIEARELIIHSPAGIFYGVSSRQTVADIYRPFQTDLRNGLYRSPASQ